MSLERDRNPAANDPCFSARVSNPSAVDPVNKTHRHTNYPYKYKNIRTDARTGEGSDADRRGPDPAAQRRQPDRRRPDRVREVEDTEGRRALPEGEGAHAPREAPFAHRADRDACERKNKTLIDLPIQK